MKTYLITLFASLSLLVNSQTDFLSDTKNKIKLYNTCVKQKKPELLPYDKLTPINFAAYKKDKIETDKCREYIHNLISGKRIDSINQKIRECLPDYFENNNSIRYAIRKVDIEYSKAGTFDEAYQLYFFAKKKPDDFFGIYFQSDAFLYRSIDTVMEDMYNIQSRYENSSISGNDTRLSYFTGIYFFDIMPGEYHLQLNLCSPENLLSDRKVFRVQCCKSVSNNICDLTPDNSIIAYKTHEYRKYNPDRIYATNPYSLYFSNKQQLDNWARLCKGIVKPSYNIPEDNSCICRGNMKNRAVFGDVYEKFESTYNDMKVYTLFFDRNGDLYPPFSKSGPCEDICEFSASVRTYYEQNNNSDFDEFETNQINQLTLKINKHLNSPVKIYPVFLTLGFDNTFEDANPKLDSLIDKIQRLGLNKQFLFIKIIWDGTQTSNLEGLKKKIAIANNFRYANGTSYEVGDKLRKILRGINNQNIYFITHSLGANIACESVFSQITKVPERLQKETQEFYILNNKQESPFALPTNKFLHLALVAPAMPGVSTFKDITDLDTSINNLTTTNKYKFIVGVNPQDSTLSKKFVKNLNLGSKFSSTTLGYDIKETEQVQKLFNKEKNSKVSFTPFFFSQNQPLYAHDILFYLKSPVYTEILYELFKE